MNNDNYITIQECDHKIAEAITRHNRNASMISMTLGIILLALFAEGLFRMMGLIPPFMGIDVNVINDIVDKVTQQIVSV